MNFINIPKTTPIRKYIVNDMCRSSWSSDKIKGIYELDITSGDIILNTERFIVVGVNPIVNTKLNNIGVNHILYCIKLESDLNEITKFLDSDEFKQLERDENIGKILD